MGQYFYLKCWSISSIVAICQTFAFAEISYSANKQSDFHNQTANIDKLSAVSYVTWWSCDATGYHPTILLKLENESSKNLSGQQIAFQGRFADLNYGIITVAKRFIRQPFSSHQQIYLLLIAPRAFDLPIDKFNWPKIECKVMCRVGNVGDNGTQTLTTTPIEAVTMTFDDAMDKISRMPY